MATRTHAVRRGTDKDAEPRRRWVRPALVIGGVLVGIAAFVSVLIYINHRVDQNACRRYADLFVTAMGDGVSTPAPSTAGLDPGTAQAVRNSRANYQKVLSEAEPGISPAEHLRESQNDWKIYVARSKAYIERIHGC